MHVAVPCYSACLLLAVSESAPQIIKPSLLEKQQLMCPRGAISHVQKELALSQISHKCMRVCVFSVITLFTPYSALTSVRAIFKSGCGDLFNAIF